MRSNLNKLVVSTIEQSFKSKMLISINVIFLLIAIVSVNFTTVVDIFFSNDKVQVIHIIEDATNMLEQRLTENTNITITYENTANNEVVEVFLSEKSDGRLHLKLVSDVKVQDEIYNSIVEEVNYIKNENFTQNNNITEDDISILLEDVEVEIILNKLNQTMYDKYGYIILLISLVAYFIYTLTASQVSSTVGVEKSNKITEYMLTSMSSRSYLCFIILQNLVLAIIQPLLTFVYYLIANMINIVLVGDKINLSANTNNFNSNFANIDRELLLILGYTIIQIILSVIIVAIIQALITSRVTNKSDISSSNSLVIAIVVIATMIIPNFVNDGEIINIFLKIVAMIPILSTVLVPKLILLDQISMFMVVFSLVVSVITIICLLVFGSRYFRKGLLGIQSNKVKNKRTLTLNEIRFKNTIFYIGISLCLVILLSNSVGLIIPLVFAFLGYNGGNSTIWSTIITYTTYMLVPYLYFKLHLPKEDKKDVKNLKNTECIKYILITQPVVLIIQLIVSFIAEKLNITFSGISNDMIGVTGGILNSILVFTAVAILPAILEELLFRKGIMTLTKRYGVWFSIILSSAIFGIIHGNVIQSIFAFFMGMVIGFVYAKTKKLWPCIIIHLLNNGLAAIALINPSLEGTVTIITIVMAVIGLLMFIVRIKYIKQDYKLEKVYSCIYNKKVKYNIVFTCVPFLFSISFYVLIIIYTNIIF